MALKYGIYQSSPKSCIFYKQDEDGNQSTFNILVTPDQSKKDSIMAFIDNEGMKQENWSKMNVTKVEDIVEAFNGWAANAPLMFEIEAIKSMSNCLSKMIKEE